MALVVRASRGKPRPGLQAEQAEPGKLSRFQGAPRALHHPGVLWALPDNPGYALEVLLVIPVRRHGVLGKLALQVAGLRLIEEGETAVIDECVRAKNSAGGRKALIRLKVKTPNTTSAALFIFEHLRKICERKGRWQPMEETESTWAANVGGHGIRVAAMTTCQESALAFSVTDVGVQVTWAAISCSH